MDASDSPRHVLRDASGLAHPFSAPKHNIWVGHRRRLYRHPTMGPLRRHTSGTPALNYRAILRPGIASHRFKPCPASSIQECQTSACLGGHEVGRIAQNREDFGQFWVDFGQLWSELHRIRAEPYQLLRDFDPTWVGFDQIWTSSTNLRKSSADFGANAARFETGSAKCDLNPTNLWTTFHPIMACHWAMPARPENPIMWSFRLRARSARGPAT